MGNDCYCFPEFASSSATVSDCKAADRNTFQPAYQSNTFSDKDRDSEKQIDDVELALTGAFDKGYDNGYQQGVLEGTRIAQSALMPGFEHLAALLNQIFDITPQISEITIKQTVNLAEAIVARVTGETSGSSEYQTERFQNVLDEKINHALQFFIHLNEDDLKIITDLIENSEASSQLQIIGNAIKGNSSIQSGDIQFEKRTIDPLSNMTVEDLTDHPSK